MKIILTICATFVLLAGFAGISSPDGEKREITLEEAIAIAIKDVPGNVIKAELEKGYYEIKIRTRDGETKKVYIDAVNGSVLERPKS